MSESEILAHALKLATETERAAYLNDACAGNPQLRTSMEALLRAHGVDSAQSAGSQSATIDMPTPRPWRRTHRQCPAQTKPLAPSWPAGTS